MNVSGEGQKYQDGAQTCMACERFGIRPAATAVDPSGQSSDEADRLCRLHWTRVMRGYCLLCGAGKVWASPFQDPSIGCCRGCLIEHHGLNRARWIERDIESGDDERTQEGESPWRHN